MARSRLIAAVCCTFATSFLAGRWYESLRLDQDRAPAFEVAALPPAAARPARGADGDDGDGVIRADSRAEREPGRHACRLVRVVDGDTLVVDLHVGRDIWQHGLRVRLAGLDAPELPTPAGQASRDALAAKLAGATIEIEETGADKYGRLLATLSIVSPADRAGDVNAWLLEQGLAAPYAGGKR